MVGEDESYDFAHFELIMRAAARIRQAHPLAGYLAHETACPGINLLHLSSRKAVEATLALPRVFPHLDAGQGYTPFEGQELSGRVITSLARVNPQLSTGFPVSPAYPHIGDNVTSDPNS